MKKYIWDTGALTLYFAGHEETHKIMTKIISGKNEGYIPTQVLIEFYYKTWQKFGEQAAKLRTITLQDTQNKELMIESIQIYDVGRLKVHFPKLSLVDAQVLILGKSTNSTILTTDEYLAKASTNAIKLEY